MRVQLFNEQFIDIKIIDRIFFLSLLLISIIVLFSTPTEWQFEPDSGIYVGTALNMLADHEYTFNGYPNLHYYPGVSSLLSIPIGLFGLDFYVLNILYAFILVAFLYAIKNYFNVTKYGAVFILLPFEYK